MTGDQQWPTYDPGNDQGGSGHEPVDDAVVEGSIEPDPAETAEPSTWLPVPSPPYGTAQALEPASLPKLRRPGGGGGGMVGAIVVGVIPLAVIGGIAAGIGGIVAATGPDGSLLLTVGPVDAPVLPRSSLKPLQTVAMLRAGAVLDGEELVALASASHSGEDFHQEGARRILASVGLTEEQAKAKYGEVEVLNYNLGGNGKSQILKTQGFVKLVRAKDGAVVGLHMVGSRVGELIGEAQLITSWEAWPDEVAALPHAHPTLDEALGEAHLALAGRPLHTHG